LRWIRLDVLDEEELADAVAEDDLVGLLVEAGVDELIDLELLAEFDGLFVSELAGLGVNEVKLSAIRKDEQILLLCEVKGDPLLVLPQAGNLLLEVDGIDQFTIGAEDEDVVFLCRLSCRRRKCSP